MIHPSSLLVSYPTLPYQFPSEMRRGEVSTQARDAVLAADGICRRSHVIIIIIIIIIVVIIIVNVTVVVVIVSMTLLVTRTTLALNASGAPFRS